jgi:deoxyribose-phosphate aldolase
MEKDLASYIDHTLLKSDATSAGVEKLCQEAVKYNFCSVCVNSSRVSLAAGLLKGSRVKVCSVIGFPLGAMSSEAKRFEAEKALSDGASEIDMVLNIGALKDGNTEYTENDIRMVRQACGKGVILKVIIETCLLTDDEKRTACRIAVRAGADFVKTSTGFSGGGATVEDVRLMKEEAGGKALVKASGGIRSYEDAVKMIEAGASRLGTSAGIAIIQGASGTENH